MPALRVCVDGQIRCESPACANAARTRSCLCSLSSSPSQLSPSRPFPPLPFPPPPRRPVPRLKIGYSTAPLRFAVLLLAVNSTQRCTSMRSPIPQSRRLFGSDLCLELREGHSVTLCLGPIRLHSRAIIAGAASTVERTLDAHAALESLWHHLVCGDC